MTAQISRISGLSEARGHHFYARCLDEKSVVFDLGSHLGEFSTEIGKSFGCQCYAIEALPSLYDKIQESSSVKKFNYAITDTKKLVKFCISNNLEGNHVSQFQDSDTREENEIIIDGISLAQFSKEQSINEIDLLKVDIEGSEIQLFDSTSDEILRSITQISVEFHDFILDINDDVERIIKRLKSLGFICVRYSFYTNGDVLFLNNKRLKINSLQLLYIRLFSRYPRGFFRAISKCFHSYF